MPLWEDFRMPTRALRQQYAWWVGALLVGCLVPAIRGFQIRVDIYVFATSFLSRRRVWVAMSEHGVRSRGVFGRTIVLPWSERVSLLPQPGKGVPGMRYGKVGEDGIPSFAGAIFIPNAILGLPDFRRAVEKFSPPNHPLRGPSKNAT
jgi:hypothetical protein